MPKITDNDLVGIDEWGEGCDSAESDGVEADCPYDGKLREFWLSGFNRDFGMLNKPGDLPWNPDPEVVDFVYDPLDGNKPVV
jgi:hypothetical protein